MRGGRIFVVDSDSYNITKQFNIAATGKKDVSLGKQYIKTIYDLMSDILTLNKGDLVFFWESYNKRIDESGRGIIGVYEVISEPYYDPSRKEIDEHIYLSESYPFRVDIEEIISFDEHLSEYDLFSRPDVRSKVWNLIGKKVGGKSRGSIPLTPLECEILIHLLSEINGGITLKSTNTLDNKVEDKRKNLKIIKRKKYSNRLKHRKSLKTEKCRQNSMVSSYKNYLEVNLNIGSSNTNIYNEAPNLNELDFNRIQTVDDTKSDPKKYEVTQEKILEAWLSKNIRLSNNLDKLFGPKDYIGWYSSYLPYSLDQKEIDFMVFHNHPRHNFLMRISLVELKKGAIGMEAIDQVCNYFDWAELNLVPGTKSIIQPIVIGKKPSPSKLEELKTYVQNVKVNKKLIRDIWLVGYEIDMEKNDLIFENLNFEYPEFL